MTNTYKERVARTWFTYTFEEQLGNVGSDVDRIISWRKKDDEEYAKQAFYRALDLLDLTISDHRWSSSRIEELYKLREMLCNSFYGGREYSTQLDYLSKYFFQFALMARKDK